MVGFKSLVEVCQIGQDGADGLQKLTGAQGDAIGVAVSRILSVSRKIVDKIRDTAG